MAKPTRSLPCWLTIALRRLSLSKAFSKGLGDGQVGVDLSTGDPASVNDFRQREKTRGPAFNAVPCSGSPVPAEQGNF